MENNENLNKKAMKNAESSYFLILLNLAFFFSHDKDVNHPFVKAHTKTASIIHLLFLLTYIIFIHFQFLSLPIYWLFLNKILAAIISLGLLWMLLLGIYKAGKGKSFWIGEVIHIAKKEKLLDVNADKNLDEKDKLSLILSYIPLLWIFIAWKYRENKQIENSASFNLFASFIILSSFLAGHHEVGSIFLLFYTVFIVFSALMIFSQDTLIHINMLEIGNIKKHYNKIKDSISYLENYFSKEKFSTFSELEKIKSDERKKNEDEELKELEKKENFPWHEILIYLPLVNFLTLSKLATKKNIQIINGFWISLLLLLILIIPNINNAFSFLLVFPIFYGLAFWKDTINYKLPFFFDIGNIFIRFWTRFSQVFKKAKTIQQTEKKANLKVWEEKKEEK